VRDARYFEFRPELKGNDDLKEAVESDRDVQAREQALMAALDGWWGKTPWPHSRSPEVAGIDVPAIRSLEELRCALGRPSAYSTGSALRVQLLLGGVRSSLT
jgi:hypothetical protein